MSNTPILIITPILMTLLAGCGDSSSEPVATGPILLNEPYVNPLPYDSEQNTSEDLRSKSLVQNETAYITSQCYTKTEDASGNAHNPCMNCHVSSKRPNYTDDWDLQEGYAFNEYTKVNRFTNLFKDRSTEVAAMSDAGILDYVRRDNYRNATGHITIAEELKNVPSTWDFNGNGQWDGYIPDCYFDFDKAGFDRAPNGSYSGWRAFGYYPFLGTFWPTNGSTDDVLIRLPKIFMQDSAGNFSIEAYTVNLAVVEAMIKETDITIAPVDEREWNVDLDRDGTLGTATQIIYDWAPLKERYMSYVGRAKEIYDTKLAEERYLPMAAGLYPEGTEFLHSVRYLDVNGSDVTMAKRMKELRYGRKYSWNSYPQLQNAALAEVKEKHDFPERLRTFVGNVEAGLQSGQGWIYQGFIEDRDGHLRPQTHEETTYCMGCHSGIGATVDSTFVFPRKFDHSAEQMGWYHSSQSAAGFKGIKEPRLADGRYEYTLYLEANHAGNEFRDNEEVLHRFFDGNGSLLSSEVEKLHADISRLIVPSPERALRLNKAYKVIVDEQSYIYGRDAHVKPMSQVHENVEADQSTGVTAVIMERYPLQ
jgi:hypothetical protein